MTKTLEKAVDAASKLPPKQQKRVASLLMEEVVRTELLAKIDRAERDIAAGRVLTMEQARARMKRWLK
jgi:hypothetical protein